MRILVAIANYGLRNSEYLDELLSAYRKMPIEVSIVVLSNIKKELDDDVEIRIGIPKNNPWSLPFAHRTLFREQLPYYDYFVYSEDDTLLNWNNFQAFINSQNLLESNEIAGFLRTEKAHNGKIFYSTCHSSFRWLPGSVRKRGNELWAKYSNEHSACFVASKEQIRKAIECGGFPVEPHEGRFDMLCSAATDIYTKCGYEKIICIDRIDDFSLPHLPNKYIGIMGLPQNEMDWQIGALKRVYKGELSEYELLEPETKLPGCYGSKWFREEADPIISKMLDRVGKNILVWGSGDGNFEADLKKLGYRVSVFPLNSIMGECCRQRGFYLLPPGKDNLPDSNQKFDAVVMRDILHLVENPETLLVAARGMLNKGGMIILRVPNFLNLRMLRNFLTDSKYRGAYTRDRIGAEPFTVQSLKKLVVRSGFSGIEQKSQVPQKFLKADRLTLHRLSHFFCHGIYLRATKN